MNQRAARIETGEYIALVMAIGFLTFYALTDEVPPGQVGAESGGAIRGGQDDKTKGVPVGAVKWSQWANRFHPNARANRRRKTGFAGALYSFRSRSRSRNHGQKSRRLQG